MAFKLREYQINGANDAIDCLVNRGLSFCLCLPAQTGKTNTVYQVIKQMVNMFGQSFVTLFVTPRKFITRQGAKEAENFFPPHRIGYINSTTNTEKKILKEVDNKLVIVADLKTIINRLKKYPFLKNKIKLLVVDEAHFSNKKEKQESVSLVEELRAILKDCYQMGVTATPHDDKGKYIDTYDVIYDKYNTSYMVDRGYLAETIVYQASIFNTHKKEYEVYEKSLKYGSNGEITNGSLSKATNSKAGKILTEAMIRVTISKNILRRGERALVYTGSIEQSNRVVEAYKQHGLRAVTVHSEVKNPLELIDRFNKGEFDILVSVDMLIMGVVVKNVKKSLFYREIGSWITYIQVWNRGRGGSREQTKIPNELYFFTKAFSKKGHADDFTPHHENGNKKENKQECKRCKTDLKKFPNRKVREKYEKGFYFAIKECVVCGFQSETQRSLTKEEVYDGDFDIVKIDRRVFAQNAIIEKVKYNLKNKLSDENIEKIGLALRKVIPKKDKAWVEKLIKISMIEGRNLEVSKAIVNMIKQNRV